MNLKKYLFRFFIFLLLSGAGLALGMKMPVRALTAKDQDFLLACKKNAAVNSILQEGANLKSIDSENGYTGMHYACMNGNFARVKWFLQNCPDMIDMLSNDQKSPAQIASDFGHNAIKQYLLDAQIIRFVRDFSGHFFKRRATALFEQGANVNAHANDVLEPVGETKGFTPLLYTCLDGEVEKAKFLLSNGADVNQKSAIGVFPLFVLFSSGADEKKESKKFKFMELLLEYGTDLTLTGPGNESVLTPAILSNSIECVEFLLKKNIDVNVVDRRGRTPFHYAAEQASMEVIKMLLDAGALINVVDNAGKTPLMLAKKNPHKASLTYLQKESRNPARAQKKVSAIGQSAPTKKVTEKAGEQDTNIPKKKKQTKKKKKKKEQAPLIQIDETPTEDDACDQLEKESLVRTEEYKQKLHDLQEEKRKLSEAQTEVKQPDVAPLEREPAPIEQPNDQVQVPQVSKIKKPKKSLVERVQEKAVDLFITPQTKKSFADILATQASHVQAKKEIIDGNLKITVPIDRQKQLMITGHQENPLAKINKYSEHVDEKRNDPNDPFHSFSHKVEEELGYLAQSKVLKPATRRDFAKIEYTIPGVEVSFVGGKNKYYGDIEWIAQDGVYIHRVIKPHKKQKKQLMLPAPTSGKGTGAELPK